MRQVAAGDTRKEPGNKFTAGREHAGVESGITDSHDTQFDSIKLLLPEQLAWVQELDFLTEPERRLYRQVQGRTFVNMYSLLTQLVEGGQKHQPLLLRLEQLAASLMSTDYRFTPDLDKFRRQLLSGSRWAVSGLGFLIRQFTRVHIEQEKVADPVFSGLWLDVFPFPVNAELAQFERNHQEWIAEDGTLTQSRRETAITELLEFIAALDVMLQEQARQDAHYFIANCYREFNYAEHCFITSVFLKAYRYQYLEASLQSPNFIKVLDKVTTPAQAIHFEEAIARIVAGRVH